MEVRDGGRAEPATLPRGLERRPDTGQWVVRSQDLANIVLRDPHIGMSLDPDRRGVELPGPDEVPSVPQFFELWYRRSANDPVLGPRLRKAYSATAINPSVPVFDGLAADLAAALPARGDLVDAYITPYCLNSTFALMGFPRADWPSLTKAYHVLMYVIRQRFLGVLDLPERHRRAFAATMRFLGSAVRAAVTAREPSPLMAALAGHAADHETSVWADVATIGQLLAAGVPQVNTGVAVSVRALYTGDMVDRVRANEVTVEQVAEEAMRLTPPFLVVAGWVNETCDCLGVRLEPRSAILVDIPAVNCDPERVPDPAAFCPTRSRADNITFGRGRHYCLGATAARAQVAAALRGLLKVGAAFTPDVAALRIDNDGFSQSAKSLPFVVDSGPVDSGRNAGAQR